MNSVAGEEHQLGPVVMNPPSCAFRVFPSLSSMARSRWVLGESSRRTTTMASILFIWHRPVFPFLNDKKEKGNTSRGKKKRVGIIQDMHQEENILQLENKSPWWESQEPKPMSMTTTFLTISRANKAIYFFMIWCILKSLVGGTLVWKTHSIINQWLFKVRAICLIWSHPFCFLGSWDACESKKC